jgi:hypothetical protein
MLTTFLFPVLLTISIALTQAAFSKLDRKPEGNEPRFRISKGVRTFCWIAVVATSLVPLAFTLSGATLTTGELLASSLSTLFLIACYVWGDMYVVFFLISI